MATWPAPRLPFLDWSMASHRHAVTNARGAVVACSRRRLEREMVAAYLLGHAAVPAGQDGRANARVSQSG